MRNQTNQSAIVPGSLSAIAQSAGGSIAEAFVSADHIIVVDTSGSMQMPDAPGGMTRYDAACAELAKLQGKLPGKIAVISFSSTVLFCPGGVPINLGGGTALDEALAFVHIADGLVASIVVISDGEPNSQEQAIREARKFTTKIDTVYVGPESGEGREFLARLAKASGGEAMVSHRVQSLADNVQQLLLSH